MKAVHLPGSRDGVARATQVQFRRQSLSPRATITAAWPEMPVTMSAIFRSQKALHIHETDFADSSYKMGKVSEMTSHWLICVPGPSLDSSTVPGEGTVACVNVALKHAPRCDYWACYDAPNDVHREAISSFRQHLPTIVTHRSRHHNWVEFFREAGVAKDKWPRIVHPSCGPPWYRAATRRAHYSIFMAIAFDILEGAKRVSLFGCDMEGIGY
jgi:hypothetical protein